MYFLSVYAIFKNEGEIFKEWLEHYLSQGVDHFYLIDNGSTDNYKDIIKPFMDCITLIFDDERGDKTQSNIYNRHILPVLPESKWVIGIDMDEFIYTKNGTIASNLKNLDDNIGQILIPWKYFGSSGHEYQPSSVVDSFVYRRKAPFTAFTKIICKCEALEQIGIHSCSLKDGYITIDPLMNKLENIVASDFQTLEVTEDLICDSKFCMNHYMIQSLDWFRRIKMTRGSTNFSSNHRNEEYFKEWDYNDVLDDELACKKQQNLPLVIIVFMVLLFYIYFVVSH